MSNMFEIPHQTNCLLYKLQDFISHKGEIKVQDFTKADVTDGKEINI